MQVNFKGFKCGPVSKTLGNGEHVGPALRALGIDTAGVAVLVNGIRVIEADLNGYQLRDGDTVEATVKALGGNDEPAANGESAAETKPEAGE